jgi:outer membrane protein assembly factor BamB
MRLATNLPALALLLATAAHAQTETLAPASNHPNSTANVTGSGYAANEAVDIYFDTTDEQLAVTNSKGAFAATPVPVPASALPGTHYITATGRRSGDAAQETFTVATTWPRLGEGNHSQSTNLYENVLSPYTVSGLDIQWNYTTGNAVETSPAVAGGRLFICSDDESVYALSASTGAKLWSAATSGPVYGSPTFANGVVYAGSSDGYLYAFNAATGALLWRFQTGGQIQGSPAVANGNIYFQNADGYFYSVNSSGAENWVISTGATGGFPSSPAIAEGNVYFTTGNGYLYRANLTNGAWYRVQYDSSGIYSSPAVSNGVVYFGTNEKGFFAVNAQTLEQIWNQTAVSQVLSGAAVANGIVYVGEANGNGTIWALSAETGAIVWSFQTNDVVQGSPVVANGVVYAGVFDPDDRAGEHLYAFDALYGNVYWTASNGFGIDSAPTVANGMLYVGSVDDNVYAYALGAGGTAKIKPPSIAALRALQPKDRSK